MYWKKVARDIKISKAKSKRSRGNEIHVIDRPFLTWIMCMTVHDLSFVVAMFTSWSHVIYNGSSLLVVKRPTLRHLNVNLKPRMSLLTAALLCGRFRQLAAWSRYIARSKSWVHEMIFSTVLSRKLFSETSQDWQLRIGISRMFPECDIHADFKSITINLLRGFSVCKVHFANCSSVSETCSLASVEFQRRMGHLTNNCLWCE